MPAKKITVPVTADMAKALDELCELHALQLPSLASMLLRDALAGRRSALLPKRVQTPQGKAGTEDGSQSAASGKEVTGAGGGRDPGGRPNESAVDETGEGVNDEQAQRNTDTGQ